MRRFERALTLSEPSRINRKQRRAAHKQGPSPAADPAAQLFADARRCQQENKLDEAARAYKRLLLRKPDHAEASNNLACVLQAQGKLAEASPRFARALALTPQLFETFGPVCATLAAILPPLGEAMRRANRAWPNRPPLDSLLAGAGLPAIAADPLLLTILRSSPARDVALERVLSALRAALLEQAAAAAPADDTTLTFMCALAQQCFINEYVFATTPAEDGHVEQLTAKRHEISPAQLAALAMYMPLHTLPDAQGVLDRAWPAPVDEVVTQQWREPLAERALRSAIAAPDGDRRRGLVARATAIRGEPLSALGACRSRSDTNRHRRLFARHVSGRRLRAARQDGRPRHARGRLRHRLACHWNCSEIQRRPGARHRSQFVQPGLRQT